MTNEQVVDFVSKHISLGKPLTEVAEAIVENCLATDAMAGIGCDNMTVVICGLLHGQTEDEWRAKIVERVNNSDPSNVPDQGVN
jgi:protein phosphatase 2C family protein 2/3